MRSSTTIQLEIIEKFGFFPPFFEPAMAVPRVLENLWQQTLSAYIDNPIPAIFKEKLSASLARYCVVPYCLLCHSSALRPMGLKASEVLALLQEKPTESAELAKQALALGSKKLATWPESNSATEAGILACAIAIFLNHDTEGCQAQLRRILPDEYYEYLNLFLAYNRTCLAWAEAHPELDYSADQRVRDNYRALIEEDPSLGEFFKNYQGHVREQSDRKTFWLTQENKALIVRETELRELSQKNENLVRSLLNSTAEGIWGIGLDGLISFVNPAAISLFGYSSADELVGKNSHELVHYKKADGSHYPQATCPIFHAFKQGVPVHLEDEVLWRKDGSFFYAAYSSTPIIEDGEIAGAVVTFVDTTTRRQALEELKTNQQWLAATLHGIGDAVIATDASDVPKVTFINGVAENLTGWTLADAKGKPVDEIFKIINEKSRENVLNPIYQVLKTGVIQTLANHTSLISKDGAEYIIEDSAAPILETSGKIQGAVLIFRDVTEQKKLENEKDEANRKIETARKDLEDFFLQAPTPMIILEGPEHKVTLANHLFEQLVARKVVGKTLRKAFAIGEVALFIPILDQVFQTGEPFVGKELPLKLLDENGHQKHQWIDIGCHPYRDASETIKGVYVVVHDVTASVEARRSVEASERQLMLEREKLEAIFYGTDAPMALYRGENLVYEMVNQSFLKMLGHRAVVGKPLAEALPEIAGSKFPIVIREVYSTGKSAHIIEGHVMIMNPATELIEDRYFDTSLTRIKSGSGNSYFVVAQSMDTTERVQNRLLLESSKVEAERANETKSSFLANMSHEIRTPLGAIIGFSELLRDDAVDGDDRRRFIDVINRNAKSLTRVIDDILDLSKVEAGRLDIEMSPTSLREILQDVLGMFTDRMKSLGIELILEIPKNIPDRIQSDVIRLRQIMVNLVGNAVKFTERGSVTVSVLMLEPPSTERSASERSFAISVKDTGRGLTLEQRSKLFQPFSQADNTTTREYGGTGLGLVLSRRLANALGGNVEIEQSEFNKGSTFVVTFKAQILENSKPALVHPVRRTAATENPLQDLRILLVEDSPDNQMLIKRVLSRNGANVVIADDGAQGVNRSISGEFDLVLMDIQMPVMDGYTAMAKLKGLKYKTPVVALTAHAMEEERNRTKSAGFTAHVTKPIEFPVLIETILDVINHSANPEGLKNGN